LLKILKWNYAHNIDLFRMGSGIFPWGTEYDLTTLPHYAEICEALRAAGNFAINHNQRVTAHPDHFVKLGSTKQNVIDNSIKDLELHSTIFDLMGLSATPYNAINIHVGMNYSLDVAEQWIASYNKLSPNLQSRLVVENDDKASAFSVQQLYDTLYTRINIPITFDYFHHTFHADNLTTEEAARLAASTWPVEVMPLFHYSESKNINENVTGNPRAHADYVFSKIDDFGLTIAVDLECKSKELGLFKYREILNKS
jgi:UV DNA damage endonuclease